MYPEYPQRDRFKRCLPIRTNMKVLLPIVLLFVLLCNDAWTKDIIILDANQLKIEERGKGILAKNQKDKYTFIPNGKTSRTQSDMVDVIIGVNGKRRRYK